MALSHRRSFDKDFKLEAVKLLLNDDRTAKELGVDLGVNPSLLHRWKREYLSTSPSESFPGKGRQSGEQEELTRLRRELEQVKTERNILKKAVGIFSHQR